MKKSMGFRFFYIIGFTTFVMLSLSSKVDAFLNWATCYAKCDVLSKNCSKPSYYQGCEDQCQKYQGKKNDPMKKCRKVYFDSVEVSKPFDVEGHKSGEQGSAINPDDMPNPSDLEQVEKDQGLQGEGKTPEVKEAFDQPQNKIVSSPVNPRKLPTPPYIEEISKLYTSDLPTFVQMIFAENPESAKEAPKFPPVSPKKIIYNQEGYEEGIVAEANKLILSRPDYFILGKSINFNGIPIGYNISLPPGEVKAIFVSVYGGDNKDTIEERANKPGYLSSLEQSLLGLNIAVVSLNLVDLLKLDVYQADMPQELHTQLHASINKFFEVLSKNPQSLAPLLRIFAGIPIYLFGASFGGRTAIRHAELYPGTFRGYISHDGSINFLITVETQLKESAIIKT